jgi:hypothetical protein
LDYVCDVFCGLPFDEYVNTPFFRFFFRYGIRGGCGSETFGENTMDRVLLKLRKRGIFARRETTLEIGHFSISSFDLFLSSCVHDGEGDEL